MHSIHCPLQLLFKLVKIAVSEQMKRKEREREREGVRVSEVLQFSISGRTGREGSSCSPVGGRRGRQTAHPVPHTTVPSCCQEMGELYMYRKDGG